MTILERQCNDRVRALYRSASVSTGSADLVIYRDETGDLTAYPRTQVLRKPLVPMALREKLAVPATEASGASSAFWFVGHMSDGEMDGILAMPEPEIELDS